MAAPARALRDGDLPKTNMCLKGECDMIAEAAPIAEDPSTKKESRAKSAAPYLLTDSCLL
jgi:hypothetical protein